MKKEIKSVPQNRHLLVIFVTSLALAYIIVNAASLKFDAYYEVQHVPIPSSFPVVLSVVGYKACQEFKTAEDLENTIGLSTKVMTKFLALESVADFQQWMADHHFIVTPAGACAVGLLSSNIDSGFPEVLSMQEVFAKAHQTPDKIGNENRYASRKYPLRPKPQIPPLTRTVIVTFSQNHIPIRAYFTKKLGFQLIENKPSTAGVYLVGGPQSQVNARRKSPRALINNIGPGGQQQIGGSKESQLQARIERARHDGCEYSELGVQPLQYRMSVQAECTAFFETFCWQEKFESKLWIAKPARGFHGSGIHVYSGCKELRKKYRNCRNNKENLIVMDYVDSALLEGHKFDLRTYSLVASTKPFIFFYHDGFARKAGSRYTNDTSDVNAHITNAVSQPSLDHFWGFDRLGEYLESEYKFPEGFLQNEFRDSVIKIQNFVLQSAIDKIVPEAGNFQVYAHDWILDRSGRPHLLEANSKPWVRNYPVHGYPGIWKSMLELVQKIHINPNSLGDMAVGMRGSNGKTTGSGENGGRFRYEDWILMYNQLEEELVGKKYNSCEDFGAK